MKLQIRTRPAKQIVASLTLLFLLSAGIAQNQAKQPGELPPQCAWDLADPHVAAEGARGTATSTVAVYDPQHEGARPPRSGADPLDPLWKAYQTAVEHVSVWRNEDVRTLKPLTVGRDGTVEVVTVTKYDVTSPLYGDTWVTIVPELQTACRHFTGDVAMQVRELLGVPPNHQIPTMVVMKVQAADIFRPTPDPTPWTLCPCGNPASGVCNFAPAVQCGNSFPKDVAISHVQWIASTTFSVRQIPDGFPWTHLGYTYNWKPGADPYGASEYIVRKGATVVVVAKASLEEYCKP